MPCALNQIISIRHRLRGRRFQRHERRARRVFEVNSLLPHNSLRRGRANPIAPPGRLCRMVLRQTLVDRSKQRRPSEWLTIEPCDTPFISGREPTAGFRMVVGDRKWRSGARGCTGHLKIDDAAGARRAETVSPRFMRAPSFSPAYLAQDAGARTYFRRKCGNVSAVERVH